MQPGPLNLITDVPGLSVGNAHDPRLRSGVTVLTADHPFTAAVSVMGGAPGTRETDLLAPDKLVQHVDAIVLVRRLRLRPRRCLGRDRRAARDGPGLCGRAGPRPRSCPAAILFDLLNGGDKGWTENPYTALGRAALAAACDPLHDRLRRAPATAQ